MTSQGQPNDSIISPLSSVVITIHRFSIEMRCVGVSLGKFPWKHLPLSVVNLVICWCDWCQATVNRWNSTLIRDNQVGLASFLVLHDFIWLFCNYCIVSRWHSMISVNRHRSNQPPADISGYHKWNVSNLCVIGPKMEKLSKEIQMNKWKEKKKWFSIKPGKKLLPIAADCVVNWQLIKWLPSLDVLHDVSMQVEPLFLPRTVKLIIVN